MRVRVLPVLLSFLLLLTGSAYLIFLHSIFPGLVPFHGGGEGFTLNEGNDFTVQIPWEALTRLHLSLQANDTIELYIDGDYVCVCSFYEFVIESRDHVLLMLKSNSPVNGMFTARQEILLEQQFFAFVMILAGLVVLALSIVPVRQVE